MFPNWLRLLIVILLTLLLINLFLSFKGKESSKNFNVAILSPNREYACEVKEISDCIIFCYDLETATPLRLKPSECDFLKGLKKGIVIHFKVENLPYHLDGSIPVKLVPSNGMK